MSEQEIMKKKRIRAGHRGSVKCITSQAQEMLEGEINVAKLTQYLTSLKDKLGIISTLDSEILDATEGQDDIANEIELADITRELIETMMEIQKALSDLSSPRGRAAQTFQRMDIPIRDHGNRPRHPPLKHDLLVIRVNNNSEQRKLLEIQVTPRLATRNLQLMSTQDQPLVR